MIEQRMALMGVHKRYTSNNVNQIARRVNSGGGVYPDGVDEICGKLTEAGGLLGNILEQLSKIKSEIDGQETG